MRFLLSGPARSGPVRLSAVLLLLAVLPASHASAANTLKIYEQTGSINVYTFTLDDARLFDDTAGLPGPPSLGYGGYDFGTGGCEYYDIFFCDSAGTALDIGPGDPLPPALHLRIECWDISCNGGAVVAAPNWVSAGNNVDAVVLDLEGQLLYGRTIVDAVYGLCDEPFEAKTSNFAASALGPPDGGITKMGCGWSVITMALDPFVPPPPPQPPEPLITAVEDVGNDGGRQVRLRWEASPLDVAGSPQPVTGYALWRRIDPLPPGMAPPAAPDEPAPFAQNPLYPPGDWDYLGTVPACCEAVYATVVPTLADSTAEFGVYFSVFFVRALTQVPAVYFDSPPDSGYSVGPTQPPGPGDYPEPPQRADYLGGNYPNPFNPATEIRFGLASPGRVGIGIYDAAGRLVRTLVDGRMSAGDHAAVWNGRDDRGRAAASGVYFCRLEAGGFSKTLKMILLR